LIVKNIAQRIEELEHGHAEKPIMVLWGDWDDETICHLGGARSGDTMPWAEAKERFEPNNTLICVKYSSPAAAVEEDGSL